MAVRRPSSVPALVRSFVGVAVEGRTYRNLAYLLLAFPLGLLYFTGITVGLSLGFGLSVVLVGVPILVATLAVALVLADVERRLAALLLGVEFEGSPYPDGDSGTELLRGLVVNKYTWTGLAYLFSKFLLGTLLFVGLVTLFSTSAVMVLTPFTYDGAMIGLHLHEPIRFTPGLNFGWADWNAELYVPITITSWVVSTTWEALVMSALGVVALLGSLHACNGAARAVGWYTHLMLR